MHDYESAALEASVAKALACGVRVADVTSVFIEDDEHPRVRVVVTYELDGPQPPRVCYAWNEPLNEGHPRILLQSPDVRSPREAVRAAIHGWIKDAARPSAAEQRPDQRANLDCI